MVKSPVESPDPLRLRLSVSNPGVWLNLGEVAYPALLHVVLQGLSTWEWFVTQYLDINPYVDISYINKYILGMWMTPFFWSCWPTKWRADHGHLGFQAPKQRSFIHKYINMCIHTYILYNIIYIHKYPVHHCTCLSYNPPSPSQFV